MKIKSQPVWGTLDKLNLESYDDLIFQFTSYFKEKKFTHVQTPILEQVDVFCRSLGVDSDIMAKELFEIKDKNNGEKICLRPELTAGINRAFVDNQDKISLPWSVYSYGPMFRYEQPMPGRLRQFDQFDIELIGASNISLQAKFLTDMYFLFSRIKGFENFALKINFLGTKQQRLEYTKILSTFLQKESQLLCSVCCTRMISAPLRCLDCKKEGCISVCAKAPNIYDYLKPESTSEFEEIKKILKSNKVEFEINSKLVRGLDYYQGLVFEFYSKVMPANQNVFCAGGVYELASEFGYPDQVISIGAAVGIDRFLHILNFAKN